MRLGIMSDSHGDADATRRAISLLTARGAEKLFHCGDICGERVLDEFAGRDVTFVWGNCDDPSPILRRYVKSIGLSYPDGPVQVGLAGKRIALFHGHELDFNCFDPADADYVFYGHTHRPADTKKAGCRFINPGALYRARVYTVALLDLLSDRLTFLRLDSGQPVILSAK